jgi:type II secretion system protein N
MRRLGAPALRGAAWAAACAVLTAVFVVHGFPYDRLAATIAAAVGRATPLELQIGELGPRLSPLGPGVEATGVRIAGPGGAVLRLDRLRIRPAWSFGWLWLRPAFRIGAEAAGGRIDGTLGPGPAFEGEFGALDLEQLPLAALWPGAALRGQLDGTLDLAAAEAGPAGSLVLSARDGSATLPRLPLPLAFETLTARLAFGGDAWLRVEALSLEGPGLDAELTGALGRAPRLAEAPLDLRIELAVDPGLRAGLQGFGVPLRADGRGSLHVTGTAARPLLE